MFETSIVIIGNVLTAPEWRKTGNGHLVANFRIASTSRRLDRDTGRWVDGNNLRVRVVCWRKLAEGIAASLTVGDPVVVSGRLYTRDWTDNDNNPRTSYELEAVAVGHDLARGRGRFSRNRPVLTSGVDAEGQIGGEATALVPDDEAPAGYGDGIPEEEPPTFNDPPAEQHPAREPFDSPREPLDPAREPFDKDPVGQDELEIAVEAVDDETPRRGRRAARRQPVAV